MVALLLLLGCPPGDDDPGESDSFEPALDPPTEVVASPGLRRVDLTWTAPDTAAGYRIERGDVAGGPYAEIGRALFTEFSDTDLDSGRTYYYVVIAANADGESDPSDEVSATAR